MALFAFVLTGPRPTLDPVLIASAHARLFPGGPPLEPCPEEEPPDGAPESVSLRFADGGDVVGAFMPAPIPGDEVEVGAGFSVGRLRPGVAPFPAHAAHLTVVLTGREAGVEGLLRLTRAVAAIAEATDAVGVYWGNGQVTHERAFFVDLAASDLPLMLWTGVSVARGPNGPSFLSLGVAAQLGVEDLLLGAGAADGATALAFFFDLLAFAVKRGRAVPAGETVGRSADEKIPVTREPSPVDPERQVWRVDLPAQRKRGWW